MFVRCHLLERNKSLEDSFLQDAILHQIMNTFCLTFSTARSLSHGGITLTLLFAANEELSAGHFCNLTRFDHDELRQIWNAIHNKSFFPSEQDKRIYYLKYKKYKKFRGIWIFPHVFFSDLVQQKLSKIPRILNF